MNEFFPPDRAVYNYLRYANEKLMTRPNFMRR